MKLTYNYQKIKLSTALIVKTDTQTAGFISPSCPLSRVKSEMLQCLHVQEKFILLIRVERKTANKQFYVTLSGAKEK